MKIVNMVHGSTTTLGLQLEKGIALVSGLGNDLPNSMEAVIAGGCEALAALKSAAEVLISKGDNLTLLDPDAVIYAPVVDLPGKIICVGLNYTSHTSEIQRDQPEAPVLFSKLNNTLAAHREEIPLPDNAHCFDYEAEIVIVMGKKAKNVPVDEALNYVLGYCIGNDLTARELQSLNSQWLLGKTLDHFGPIGPYLVTADEVGDPQNLNLLLELNGETRQKAHTSEMIFSCAEIISYASRYITLLPGDIIYTGTTGGVILGYPKEERVWLKPGDEVVITIEKLGVLRNKLV